MMALARNGVDGPPGFVKTLVELGRSNLVTCRDDRVFGDVGNDRGPSSQRNADVPQPLG